MSYHPIEVGSESLQKLIKTRISSALRLVFFILLIIGSFSFCSNKKSNNNNILNVLYLTPVITAVLPQVGNPAFSTALEAFPATKVILQGRNFSQVISNNIVKFNGVQAVITSATDTEINTTVPDGTFSGVLSYTDAGKGGNCNSPDGKSGIFCSSTDFYVDCYLPYQSRYNAENKVNPGDTLTIKYKKIQETHAFKTKVVNSATVSISCLGDIAVSRFSSSCSQTIAIAQNTTTTPYIFTITGNYSAQYFVTSSLAGDCKIIVTY